MRKSWERYFTLFALTALSSLQAQPDGFQLVGGQASVPVAVDNNTLQIQTGKQAIINWNSFSIGKNETTQFIMPDASSAVLNRVTGKALSDLQGILKANGKLFLINPNGIFIGPEGQINAASFFASTLDVLNEDFLQKGELLFKGDSLGKVVNLGTIKAWDGDVVLIGRFIDNRGNIDASRGMAGLAVGGEVLLKLSGNERVFIRAADLTEEKSEEVGLENTGTISALQVELKADGNPYTLAIKDAGKIDALGMEERSGRVYLVAKEGRVEVTGSIIANAGETRVLGQEVVLKEEATIDVSGKTGGGTVLLGGDYLGKNPLIDNATFTYVGKDVSICADATENGDGGKVIVWGTDATQFLGKISARGGEESGDGGFVEISSKGFLDPRGSVSTLAPFGKTGQLLYDPTVVTISSGGTSSCVTDTSGVYTFASCTGTATLFHGQVSNDLLNTNVVINTSTGTGAVAGSITLAAGAGFSWSGPHSLTLIANDTSASKITLNDLLDYTGTGFNSVTPSITLTSPSIVIGSTTATNSCGLAAVSGQINISNGIGGASPGGLILQGTNQTSANGDASIVTFASTSTGTTPHASISINLDGDCTLIAGNSGTVFNNGANIITNGIGGNLTITTTGDFNLTGGSGTSNSQCGAFIISGNSSGSSSFVSNVTLSGVNYNLIGGAGAPTDECGAFITAAAEGGAGILSLTATGDIVLQAGTATNAAAVISNLGTTTTAVGSSSLAITMSGGDLTLQGEQADDVNGASILTDFNGVPITITGAGDILVAGGTNDLAGILTNSTSATKTSPITITCDSLTVQGNSTGTQISLGGASVLTTNGDITITATTFIDIAGGSRSGTNATINAGRGGSEGNIIINPSGSTSGNLTVASGTGSDAEATLVSGSGSITINSIGGNVTVNGRSNILAEIITESGGNITIGPIGGNLIVENLAAISALDGGNVLFGAIGGNVQLTGNATTASSTATISVGTNAGNVTFGGLIGGSVTLQGGTANSFAEIVTASGNISFSGGITGGLILNGGTASAGDAFIGPAGTTGSFSTGTIGALSLTGGSGSAIAEIITNGSSGNISIGPITGNLSIVGGSGTGAPAFIEAMAGGNISFSTIGGTVELTGHPTASNSDAKISVGNAAGNITFGGNITGAMTLQAGAAACDASITTFNGTIAFNGTLESDLVLNGGTNATAPATITAGGSSGTVSITAVNGNVLLTGGGATSSPASIVSNNTSTSVNAIAIGTIGENLILTGGTLGVAEITAPAGNIAIGTITGIGGSVELMATTTNAEITVTGTGNIAFDTAILNSVLLQGGTTASALITTTNGNVSFPAISQNVTLNAGSGTGTNASISATGTSPLGTMSFTSIGGTLALTGGTSGSTSSIAQIITNSSGGAIAIGPITGNLTLLGGAGSSATAEILASGGGNVSFSTIGGAVSLTGGSTATGSNAQIAVTTAAGSVMFNGLITGNVTLQGGGVGSCSATISSSNSNVSFLGGISSNLNLNGGSAMNTNATISALNGKVEIGNIGMSVNITGGSASGAVAQLVTDNASGQVAIGSIGGSMIIKGGTVSGGPVTGTASGIFVNGGGGVSISAVGGIGGAMQLQARADSAEIIVTGTGSITINTSIGGGLTLIGGSTANAVAQIATSVGLINFNGITGGGVSLTGGSASGTTATISAAGNVNFFGGITGSLALNGGTATNAAALITSTGGSVAISSGSSITQNLSLIGGSISGTNATISAPAGAITIGNIGMEVNIMGGTAATTTAGTAQILTSNSAGNVTMGNVGSSFTIESGTVTGTASGIYLNGGGAASIGAIAGTAELNALADNAQISVTGTGTIAMTSVGGQLLLSGGAASSIASIVTDSATGNITIGPIGSNVVLTAGNGTGASAEILASDGGNIQIGAIGGVMTLNGGTVGTGSVAQIAVTTAAGGITFTGAIAGIVTLQAGSVATTPASITTFNGAIAFNGALDSNLVLNGGSGASSPATITAGGNSGTVTVASAGGILLTGGSVSTSPASIISNAISGNVISINAITNNLTLTGGTAALAEINAAGGGNILIGSANGVGGTVELMATATNAQITVTGTGNITFSNIIRGNVTLQGGSANSASALITTTNGNISFPSILQSMTLTGGSGSATSANAFISTTGTGTIGISSIAGALSLTGGGASTVTSVAGISTNSSTGNITIGPIGTGLTIQGGAGSSATAEIITASGGNIQFGSIGGAVGVMGGAGGNALIAAQVASGAVTFTGPITGNVEVIGGGPAVTANIQTFNGNITFSGAIGQSLIVTGGSGALANASIAAGTVGQAGVLSVASIGNNLAVSGGTGSSPALITARDGGISFGPITGNVAVLGGATAITAPAEIIAANGGNIQFGSIGGALTLTGGNTNSPAQISVTLATGSVIFNGSIAGAVTLTGGAGMNGTAHIETFDGNINFPNPISSAMLSSGAGTAAAAAIDAGGTGNVSFPLITTNLTLLADAGTGTASVLAGGDITVNADQNISLSSTNGTFPTLTATGSITATTGLATMLNNGSTFEVGNAMFVEAGTNVILQNGSEFLGSTGAMTVIATIDVNLSGASTFTHSGSGQLAVRAGDDVLLDGVSTILFTSGTGNLSVTAGDDIALTDMSSIGYTTGSGNILATAGHDISLADTSNMSNTGSGFILGFAGVAAIITDTSTVNTASGNLTLVTDNDFPTPYGLGSGFLDLDGTSTIFVGMSGGPYGPGVVRLYTAIREQNTVDGLINGAPFVYGTEFVNTTTEQWLTWYPGTPTPVDPTPPITILYKNDSVFPPPQPPPVPTQPLTPNEFGKLQALGATANSQMFYMFDPAIYYFTIMKVRYDTEAYAMVSHSPGVLSSYDVARDLQLFTMRDKFYDTDGQLIPNFVYWRPE